MAQKKSGGYGELIRTVVIACAIALGIRTFLYEPFNIPSGSMIPTLLVGDYLFVSKLSYGYSRYSMPLSVPLIPGRILFTPPERGDVVVFKLPSDNSTDYIKRIVGLPGEAVQVKDGILHIDGKPVQRRQIEDFRPDSGTRSIPQFIETLPEGREHRILELGDRMAADNTPVYHVPEGHYFAMGDNRDNSRDSRFPEVGMIPAENLVGRAEVLFYSTDGSASWLEFWKWPFAVRYGRLLDAIE